MMSRAAPLMRMCVTMSAALLIRHTPSDAGALLIRQCRHFSLDTPRVMATVKGQ